MPKKIPEINWVKLEGMLIFDPTLNVCAKEMGVSHDSLERKIKENFGKTFAEYKQIFVDQTAMQLKQKMISKAMAGDNTCLIFCLKNLSKWCDRIEHGFDKDKKTILLKYNLEDSDDVSKEDIKDVKEISKDKK